jgi:hypothetical protein
MYYVVSAKPEQAIYCLVFLLIGLIIYYLANKKNPVSTKLVGVITLFLFISCNNKSSEQDFTKEIKKDTVVSELLSPPSLFDLRAAKIAGLDSNNLNERERKIYFQLNEDWSRHLKKTLLPMSDWSKSEILPYINKERYSVFYPFSGPDVAFATALYNNADNYILVGLEKAVSDESLIFSKNNIDSFLSKTPQIFFYSSRLGFFRTKDMSKQFENSGLADVIIFYLKRINCRIENVKMGYWNTDKGEVEENKKGTPANVFIVDFLLPTNKKSHIYYFSKDLSDSNLKNDSKFLDWVSTKGTNLYTFNKAASYLMHLNNFSIIRDFIVNHSKFHVQDDTGIPYKYFASSDKYVSLYGVYNRLINLFHFNFQKDLKIAYDSLEAKSLPFSLGYNSAHGESNLQTFRNR